MNGVRVFVLRKKFEFFKKAVGKSAQRALKTLNKENISVQIYLIGNAQMRFLNRKFRGKDKSTSVLSFEEPKNFPHPEIKSDGRKTIKAVGEIYLNIPYIKKETRKNNTPYSLLITQLLVHGLLHLLSYNHKKKRDRIRMENKEKLVMRTLKFYL